MTSTRADYDKTMLGVYAPPLPVFVRGEGARLWDEDGKEYIDLGGGIAVVALGHNAAHITQAINEQSQTLMHISNLFANAPAVALAKKLTQNTFAERVFFCNSGAEANEAALKLARHYGVARHANKYKVLSFSGAFHGRVGLAMAATPQAKVREGFGPLAAGFITAPFNNSAAAAEQMDDDFCAIIVEPIQGESGVHLASDEFLHTLRQLANQHNALLIFDEVQSGNGRSGELYAYMGAKVVPDILTTAKGLGGGIPIGAMLASEAAAQVMGVGAHGTTYGGNPLATKVASVVLDTILSDGFLAGVKERGQLCEDHLHELNRQRKCFSEIRRAGLLIGCDLNEGWQINEVRARALAQGVVVLAAGDNTLRLAPALNIPLSDIKTAFTRLASTFA